jgi:predicted RNA binding protein YcfA (HicA-like mRNA interferase family)
MPLLYHLPFDHATAPLGNRGEPVSLLTATRQDDHIRYPSRHMPKAARVLAALKRDGWTETRRRGLHRVLVKDDRQRIWAYHESVDLGGPAMARIAKDYGYTLAELRKL